MRDGAAPRPNILYVHSHDTGRLVQPLGHPVETPRIQRLADEGVLFRQAYSVAPTCSPSRAALLTGSYPHQTGMLGLCHRGWSLEDPSRHVVHALRAAGYRSYQVGEQHVARDPAEVGYDEVLPVPTTRAEDVAPAAAAVLRGDVPTPFFMSVGFLETHREWPAAAAPAPGPAPAMPDTPALRRDAAAFAESARAMDAGVGQVLDALEAAGLAEDTLVVCTTDHGVAFPGAKGTLSDRGVGVFLILRGPGGFTGGRVSDAMVSHLDLYPTMCELAGVPVPEWAAGHSMLPLAAGAESIRSEIFVETTWHAAYEPVRAIRTRRWKYVRRFAHRPRPVAPNVDDSAAKDLWVRAGWRDRTLDPEQLYDMILDPAESDNLVSRPELGAVLATLRARLEAWMADTDDPLRHGPVPAPPGAEFNDPDQLSPEEPTTVARPPAVRAAGVG